MPTDTVPTTQSPKRNVGTIALWPQARACWVKAERERKRVGFDWWMVWKWVSWSVSSTVFSVSSSTRSSSFRDSLVCIIASVFLRARSVWWCWHVLPNVDTVWGVEKVEWLWWWCHCRAAISLMPACAQHCVSCHTICPSFLLNGGWNSVPSRNACCVCGVNAIHSESVCCVRREIWWATHHAWLWVWSQGIGVIVIHATLLTLVTMCVVCKPWNSSFCSQSNL